MVRAIIVKDGDRTFYGTREARYSLPLESTTKIDAFAKNLEKKMIETNGIFNLKSLNGLRFCMEKKYFFDPKEEKSLSLLRKHIFGTSNIQICAGIQMIANLVSKYNSTETSESKPRNLIIYPHSVPNSVINFDPSFLYELGEKYGKLYQGVDFDVSIKNYKEVAFPIN